MYVDPILYAAEELANAIIIKAVEDYRKAMKDFSIPAKQAADNRIIVQENLRIFLRRFMDNRLFF